MKSKIVISSLLALGLSSLTALAWSVSGVVSCPNGNSAAGIDVFIDGVGTSPTAANGAYSIELPDTPATYTICVNDHMLPPGATLPNGNCTQFSVDANNRFANVDFTLGGDFCSTPPPQGPCWLTGGGTIGKTKGKPNYSYGGVVNPGCSPTAAGGGNWNVVDHLQGLHFKGLDIAVLDCSGVPDKAPKVNVNIIDFAGTGTIKGVDGNPLPLTPVCFLARAIDKGEPGGGKDMLYLNVFNCTTKKTLLLISADPGDPLDVAPVAISTGNLQIHTTGCNK